MIELKDIYEMLDTINSFASLNLEIKQRLREIINTQIDTEVIQICAKAELDVLFIQINIDNYKNMESITTIDDEYLERRTKETKNVFLLARYNHLLWLSRKHHCYAKEAIRNYLLAKDISISSKPLNNEWALDVLESITRSYVIKQNIKDNANAFDLENIIISTATNFTDDHWGFCICAKMLSIISDSHETFKNYINQDFIESIKTFCEHLITNKKAYQATELIKPVIKISKKMNFDTKKLLEILAKTYEERIIELNKSFASVNFCLYAIEIYNQLKNQEKVNELKMLYEEITKNMNFGTITAPIDISPLIDESRNQAMELMKFSDSDLFQFMAYEKLFIPEENNIISQTDQIIQQQGAFMSMLVGAFNVFDQRGNLVKVYKTDEEKRWHEIMQTYRFMMQFKTIKLNLILEELIQNNKLTEENICEYIDHSSWISYSFENNLSREYKIKYSYKNMIKKIISEYFRLHNLFVVKKIDTIDIFMFTDSFTLRFEGLIRALFDINQFPTIKQDYNTGTVMEKDLNALLHDENIKYFFDADEILFFKFLFIEQEGLNLRNKVAHSLFLELEYNFDIINWLFIALLRIIKVKVQK